MRFFILICFVFTFSLGLKAQTTIEEVEGTVSYVTSQSVYVKYPSTSGISIGDTLYKGSSGQLIPALVVKNLSSTSIVCSQLTSDKFSVNDKIIARRKVEIKKTEKTKPVSKDTILYSADTTSVKKKTEAKAGSRKQNINGFAGISGWTNFSNTPALSSYVVNYSVSVNINNMNNSKFSFGSNVMFRQENGQWENVKSNIFNGLKIYNLFFKYDITKSFSLTLGRKINTNISNIGAIDGLQAEKSFKNFYIGAFGGARPNYLNYSFDFNLLQYGAYVGFGFQNAKRNMQNSLAYVEQMNNLKTDRRFLYFQHNSSLLKNVYMFFNIEADLYKVVNEQPVNTFSLTSAYFSIRYRPFKRMSISATYDNRKNVIYYETEKSYLSTLIEEEARQGYSLQINYNIFKSFYLGLKGGYRFQPSDLRPTLNGNIFVTYSDFFKKQFSITLMATMLETAYLNGNVYSLRLSKPFISGKMYVGGGYSFVDYKIKNAELPFRQNIGDINFTTEIIKKLSLSINLEVDFEKTNQFYRAYIQLRKRF
jgi:hypothetical protein